MKVLRFAVFGIGSVALLGASCPQKTWNDGWALTFLRSPTSTIVLRYQNSGTWQETTGIQESGSGYFHGVGLGYRARDARTLLGYTKGDTLKVFAGLGLAYGSTPDDQVSGVGSAPAIVHVSNDDWLVAYTTPAGTVEVRPYAWAPAGGFGPPLTLTGTTRNDQVAGRPALGYFQGRLVLVWGRVADNRAFRFVAADYQPGSSSITTVQAGDIPMPGGTYHAEAYSGPALAHDGAGSFYLATVYRSGFSGLTHDAAFVYSSNDGTSWTRLSGSLPHSTFLTQLTRIGIAAHQNGELLLGVVSGPNNPGRMFRFSSGTWSDLGGGVFQWPPTVADFAVVRSQYLD